MNTLPVSIRALAQRYSSQRSSISRGPTHEAHDLSSLARRVMLSREEALQEVGEGRLLALSGPMNSKFIFSSMALDSVRNRTVQFIASSIVTELSRRGCDEETMLRACGRAFERQNELSRRVETIEFARTPQDSDDDNNYNGVKTAAGIGAAGLAGYGAYRYLKGRNGNNGNALPGSSPQPQLPGPRGPKPFDPNSSVTGGSSVERHPGSRSASISAPITTASSTTRKTIGSNVVDPLAEAVASGRKAIARKGSAIWQALRGIPLE